MTTHTLLKRAQRQLNNAYNDLETATTQQEENDAIRRIRHYQPIYHHLRDQHTRTR